MTLAQYPRALFIALFTAYSLHSLACNLPARTMLGQRRVPQDQVSQGTDTRSFDFYRAKTYEFLRHLYGHRVWRVKVVPMDPTDNTFDNCPAYASGNTIYLNMAVLQHYSDADNLFICAHEAAHYFCGHTHISPHNADRESLQLEQEADEVAAQMLCAHGYRWIVEDCVQLLQKDIRRGLGDVSDGQHPTSAQKYAYLQNILTLDPTQLAVHPHAAQVCEHDQTKTTSAIGSLMGYLRHYVTDTLGI